MNDVQDKQQGQGRPAGIADADARMQTRDIARTEPDAQGTSRTQATATRTVSQAIDDYDMAIEVGADMAGTSPSVVKSHTHWMRCCTVRQLAMYWMHTDKGYTQREIGAVCGRDRTTVYYAVKRIGELLAINDKQTRIQYEDFKNRINNYKPTIMTKRNVLHDTDNMPEWQKKREYLARLLTNLTFEVADVLETLWKECEERNRECGYGMRYEQARHYKGAMYHIRAFRGVTRELDAETQVDFGRDAELILDLIYSAVTRAGTDDSIMIGFLEHILKMPDRIGLDGIRRGGIEFERIKMEQAKARIEKATK